MYRKTYRRKENPATTPEDIHLVFAEKSWETGISYYELSARTSYEDWKKIAPCFTFINGKSEEWEEDEVEDLYGWYTKTPQKVEKILHVKPEWTLEEQEKRAKIRQEKRAAEKKAFTEKMQKINSFFEDAEYPDPKKEQPENAEKYMPGFEKMDIEGERINDPTSDPHLEIYGGGHWFIIEDEKYIWKIKNNGGDGDNWAWNNVNTGGAGAIGHRVPYNQELADLLRSLASEGQEVKK